MLAVWLSYTSVRAAARSPTEGNNLHDSILGRVCAVARGAGFVRITSAKDEMMEYVRLGKTGLRVSVAGLGCGGNSRLGLGRGKTEAEAIALVRQALDMGLNLRRLVGARRRVHERNVAAAMHRWPLLRRILKKS